MFDKHMQAHARHTTYARVFWSQNAFQFSRNDLFTRFTSVNWVLTLVRKSETRIPVNFVTTDLGDVSEAANGKSALVSFISFPRVNSVRAVQPILKLDAIRCRRANKVNDLTLPLLDLPHTKSERLNLSGRGGFR